jgi:hypothetical protein
MTATLEGSLFYSYTIGSLPHPYLTPSPPPIKNKKEKRGTMIFLRAYTRARRDAMTVKPLTSAQFARIIGSENGPNPALHWEIAWFASADEKRVGAVILDLVDKDFSWVLLAVDGYGRFVCVDLAVSLLSAEAAEAALIRCLAAEEGSFS